MRRADRRDQARLAGGRHPAGGERAGGEGRRRRSGPSGRNVVAVLGRAPSSKTGHLPRRPPWRIEGDNPLRPHSNCGRERNASGRPPSDASGTRLPAHAARCLQRGPPEAAPAAGTADSRHRRRLVHHPTDQSRSLLAGERVIESASTETRDYVGIARERGAGGTAGEPRPLLARGQHGLGHRAVDPADRTRTRHSVPLHRERLLARPARLRPAGCCGGCLGSAVHAVQSWAKGAMALHRVGLRRVRARGREPNRDVRPAARRGDARHLDPVRIPPAGGAVDRGAAAGGGGALADGLHRCERPRHRRPGDGARPTSWTRRCAQPTSSSPTPGPARR